MTATTTASSPSPRPRRVVVGVLACCVAVLALLAGADAKVYGRCDLAKALRTKGVALKDVPTWVCISEKLSSIDTATATDPDNDVDGTVYHGLFLISEKWWCNRGSLGCGVTCDNMKRSLESNIDCAKKVFVETKRLKGNGFRAWAAYEDCKEDDPNTQTYIETCTGLEEDEDEELDLTVFQRSGLPKDE